MFHFFGRINMSRGIVGITQQNGTRTLGDHLFEFIKRRQGKIVVDRTQQGSDNRSAGNSKSRIVGISRLRHNNFIAGIETSHKSKQHRFRTTSGDNDFRRIHLDTETIVVGRQFLTQTQQTFALRIFQNTAIDMFQRIQAHLRSLDIRLTDIQMIYFQTPGFCLTSQRNQFTDR